jgi:hypothetical protein
MERDKGEAEDHPQHKHPSQEEENGESGSESNFLLQLIPLSPSLSIPYTGTSSSWLRGERGAKSRLAHPGSGEMWVGSGALNSPPTHPTTISVSLHSEIPIYSEIFIY